MQVMRLVSWFVPSMASFAFGVELYGGLLVFAAYVLFDTQVPPWLYHNLEFM